MTNILSYRLTSPYGHRPSMIINGVHTPTFHDGADFALPQGTPVHLPPSGSFDGVVVRAMRDQWGGAFVDIVADSDGGMLRLLHLSRIDVKQGQRVKSGDLIGLSGGARGTHGAGLSTAPHLHVGLFTADTAKGGRAVDPIPWLQKAYSILSTSNTIQFTMTESQKQSYITIIQGNLIGTEAERTELVQALINNDYTKFNELYPQWIQKMATSNADLSTQLQKALHLVAELQDEVEKLEKVPAISAPQSTQEKFDWSKFIVGASKNGWTYLTTSGLLAAILALISQQYPASQEIVNILMYSILGAGAIGGTSNALRNVNKQ